MQAILIILFIIGQNNFPENSYAFFPKSLKSDFRLVDCNPTNSATPGKITSYDFGKNYSTCSNFTCKSGYTISGSNCIEVINYNVVCGSGTYDSCGPVSSYETAVYTSSNYGSSNGVRNLKFNCPAGIFSKMILTTSASFNAVDYMSGTTFVMNYSTNSPSYAISCNDSACVGGTGGGASMPNYAQLEYFAGCTKI